MSCGFGGLLHVNMGGAEWVYGPPGGTDGDSCYRPVCEALGQEHQHEEATRIQATYRGHPAM